MSFLQVRAKAKGEGFIYTDEWRCAGVNHKMFQHHCLRAGKEEIEIQYPHQLETFLEQNDIPRMRTRMGSKLSIALRTKTGVVMFNFDENCKLEVQRMSVNSLRSRVRKSFEREREMIQKDYKDSLARLEARVDHVSKFTKGEVVDPVDDLTFPQPSATIDSTANTSSAMKLGNPEAAYVTVLEAAQRLGLPNYSMVYYLVRTGRLRGIIEERPHTSSKAWKIEKASIDEYLAAKRNQEAPNDDHGNQTEREEIEKIEALSYSHSA